MRKDLDAFSNDFDWRDVRQTGTVSTLKEKMILALFREKTQSIQQESLLVTVQERWGQICGNLALSTVPLSLQREVLTVGVLRPIHSQELLLHAPVIIKKLKGHGVTVLKIKTVPTKEVPYTNYNIASTNHFGPSGADNEKKGRTTAAEQLLAGLKKFSGKS